MSALTRRILCGTYVLLAILSSAATQAGAPAKARWTIMVFLNADNNLEEFGIADFREMAQVGSSDDVNIIVQMDRVPGESSDYGDWTDTRRFRITKNMEPEAANAIPATDLPGGVELGEIDMGSAPALIDFVQWARDKYPAEYYMLDIWDHGAGWRRVRSMRARAAGVTQTDSTNKEAPAGGEISPSALTGTAAVGDYDGPVKSVSHDETSGKDMKNRQIQNGLTTLLNGSRLDIIGFDACLMAMVESGYAFRNVARFMVGSEELEPGPGWQYDTWLGPLVANPGMSPEDLTKALVKSYEDQYKSAPSNDPRGWHETTFSSIRLAEMDALAGKIDTLADALTAQLADAGELQRIRESRKACRIYAPGAGYYNIDMHRFCKQLTERSQNAAVKNAAADVAAAIETAVVAYYAHVERQSQWGSRGAAVYFPGSKIEYTNDSLSRFYKDTFSDPDTEVEFVKSHRWDNFIQAYADKN